MPILYVIIFIPQKIVKNQILYELITQDSNKKEAGIQNGFQSLFICGEHSISRVLYRLRGDDYLSRQ